MHQNKHLKHLDSLSYQLETLGEHFVIYADYASQLSGQQDSFTVLLQDIRLVAERNMAADKYSGGTLYWVALDEHGDQITLARQLEDELTSPSQTFLRLVKPFPMPEAGQLYLTKEHLNISKIEGFSWNE